MKAIDGKYAIENNRVVKITTGEPIPEEEPMFLFRGRDNLALKALEFYRNLCLKDECTVEHIAELDKQIMKFEEFTEDYPEKMKQPGITRGQ